MPRLHGCMGARVGDYLVGAQVHAAHVSVYLELVYYALSYLCFGWGKRVWGLFESISKQAADKMFTCFNHLLLQF